MRFLRIFLLGIFLCFGFSSVFPQQYTVQAIDFTKDPCEGQTCFGPPDADQVPAELRPERDFRDQILTIVNYFLSFAGLAAIVAILYGAFLWIFSGGNEENFTKGQKIVLYAAAGLILILLSYTIVRFIIRAPAGVDNEPLPPTPPSGSEGEGEGEGEGEHEIVDPRGTPFPPGTTVNPTGTITLPSGRVIPANSVINPDGSITLPDGTVIPFEETLSAPPVMAVISGGPTSGQAPLAIELSGLDSRYPGIDQTIPDGAFHWSFVDRNGQKVDLGTGHTIRHTLTESGRFVFTLSVDPRSDGPETKPGITTFAVQVTAAGPEVDFTINGTAAKLFQQFALSEAGNGLTFAPLVQNVDPAEIEEFAWDFGDGTPILKGNAAESVTHIFSRNGDFSITLTVTDRLGKTSKRSVTVSIADVVARLKTTPQEKFVGDQISFSANESKSSFGDIIETIWTLVPSDGETEEIRDANFSRSFENSGTVEVTLSIKDTSGKTAAASEILQIKSHRPQANFSFAPKSDSQPSTIVFDAALSNDVDGDVLRYSWDFQNDGSFEIADDVSTKTEFTFPETGTKNVKLQVRDENGEVAEIIRNAEIDSVLNVDFTADRFVAHPDEEITFDARSENAITFFWDFGDNSSTQGTAESTRHRYLEKGVYRVTLTVFDQDDQENSVTHTIHIGERDMPVAAFEVSKDGTLLILQDDHCGSGQSGISIARSDHVVFDASRSINAEGEGREGSNRGIGLEYEWTFHDGTFSRDRVVKKSFNELPDEGNCFPVRLTVRDEDTGKKDTAETLWIKIENAAPQIEGLRVSIPENTIAPVIVPLEIRSPRDRDGHIVEYKWWAYREGENIKIGLHTTTIPATSIVLPVYGLPDEVNRYYFIVEVTDNLGASVNSEKLFGQSNFVEVTNGENRSPIVDFRLEKTSIDAGDTITFFAEARDPLGGTIPDSAYMWDFNGDNIFDAVGTGPQVSHRFEEPGEFPVRLKVVHRGLSSSKTRDVFVARKHSLPHAAFTFALQGHNIVFNASNSAVDSSVPRNVPTYSWDFDLSTDSDGDGDPANDRDATTMKATYFYENFGNYSVKLTITDILGVYAEVIRDLAVTESGKVVSGSGDGSLASIRLKANHPLTTLDVVLERAVITNGETTNLLVFVKNANNTLFEGEVTFKILNGSATLDSESVTTVLGEGSVGITGLERGKVVIEVTAKGTVSGDVTEVISLLVE